MTADDIIARLDLQPHPEGGWYRQTWVAEDGPRPSGTCIYFLLKEGERSHWHRVDAAEIWHFYAGAPLLLRMAAEDEEALAGAGPDRRRDPAGDRPGGPLAECGDHGAVDACGLHRFAGFPVRGL